MLVVKVHDLVPEDHLVKRYHQLNSFEHFLADNDTHVLKFFLHISKEEQLRRFKRRLDDPKRQWKISDADYKERKCWDAYTEAYEEALSRCSTERAALVHHPLRLQVVSQPRGGPDCRALLEGLKLQLPAPTVDLEAIRKEYADAEKEAATQHLRWNPGGDLDRKWAADSPLAREGQPGQRVRERPPRLAGETRSDN